MKRRQMLASTLGMASGAVFHAAGNAAVVNDVPDLPRAFICSEYRRDGLMDMNLTDEEILDEDYMFTFESNGGFTEDFPELQHQVAETSFFWIDQWKRMKHYTTPEQFVRTVRFGFKACYEGYQEGNYTVARRFYIGER